MITNFKSYIKLNGQTEEYQEQADFGRPDCGISFTCPLALNFFCNMDTQD